MLRRDLFKRLGLALPLAAAGLLAWQPEAEARKKRKKKKKKDRVEIVRGQGITGVIQELKTSELNGRIIILTFQKYRDGQLADIILDEQSKVYITGVLADFRDLRDDLYANPLAVSEFYRGEEVEVFIGPGNLGRVAHTIFIGPLP
jgi:hypothetical protein